MVSKTEIFNLALQLLGANRIGIDTEPSVGGRACRDCYDILRDGELRKHPWTFAVKRAELAEESAAPDWGRAHAYQLPPDYLRLVEDYPECATLDKDWIVEGRFIMSDDVSPLRVRYIARITDTSYYDACFVQAVAAKMAEWMCERLTQSNTKKADAKDSYRTAIIDARKANAFERRSQDSPDGSWITCRQ